MGNDTNGWSEGGAAAWNRDSKAAAGRAKLDLDTSVGPERTSFPSGNLQNSKGTTNSAPARADVLLNPLTRPKTSPAKGPAGVTKAKGRGKR